MNVPLRYFGINGTSPLRAGPAGSNLWNATETLPGSNNVATQAVYGINATGGTRLDPGVNVSARTAVPTAATNKGWRDLTYSHANQNIHPTELAGQWVFTYALAGGVGVVGTMTVVVYAIDASNVATELFRNTSPSLNIGTVEANYTQTFTPSTVQLPANSILQYEFWLNITTGAATGFTFTFRAGSAGVGQTVPSMAGGTIVFKGTRALTASTTPTPVLTKLPGKRLAVGCTGTTSLIRRIGKPQTVAMTAGPTINKRMFDTMSVSTTATPRITRSTGKLRAASVTPTPTISKLPGKQLTVLVTPTPTIRRAITKTPLVALVTATPSLNKQVRRTMLVIVTPIASQSRLLHKVLTVITTPTPSLLKQVSKRLTVTTTPTPTLTPKLILGRVMIVTVQVTPRALLQIPFDKVPGDGSGGPIVIVKKPIFIFDD